MLRILPGILVLLLVSCSGEASLPRTPQVNLLPGDHVVLIGNALPERMQHEGWFESLLQISHPELKLVLRNHGFSGDRINHRPRAKGFPTPETYLNISQADVILAFFGYNESFDANPLGFQKELQNWIVACREARQQGTPSLRIVLFSPIAHEDLKSKDLPDGRENNIRLAAYTEAMQRAAEASEVGFVDLFTHSLRLYEDSEEFLTQNGIHPNALGHKKLARQMVWSLTGTDPGTEPKYLAPVRHAVLDKNWHWFNRYRATDGNDVWGGRSTLSFTDGQTNKDVLEHELTQLDVMTANRDAPIWAASQGSSLTADDANVPKPIEVVTNIEQRQVQNGKSKTGSVDYLSPEESLRKMDLTGDLQANVFASEEMFPEMVNPVQLGVDTKGRLWVAAWKTYPKWEPLKEMDDRLLILPDEDGDGVADRAITFARVHNPTGFEFWNGGVIVASTPDLLFLKDTDGDDVADVRIRILSGLDSADTHHAANNIVLGPGGNLYYQRGIFLVSNVETPWKSNQEDHASGMYRFNPKTFEFSFHAPNSPNPHGICFDRWGYHYATDGTGGRAYQVRPNGKGGFGMRKLLNHTVRPVPSSEILSSSHFDASYQERFLILNSIAFLGIKQYDLDRNPESGDVSGSEVEDFLVSSDLNFRPTDFAIGGDGAAYVSDWANAIIGHMQHNVRDPNRDHDHGRIFRITQPGRDLLKPFSLDGAPIQRLLKALEHSDNGIRHRARVELTEHKAEEVLPAMRAWLKNFDSTKQEDAHHFLEGLWLAQQQNVPQPELLATVLQSPNPHARIAAKTVELFWNQEHRTQAARPEESAVLSQAVPDDPNTILILTVPEKMRFALTQFSVKAGQEVRVRFVNPDYMPHNILFGMPGSAEEIGLAAEALGSDGFRLQFIPDNDKILAASTLLQHQQEEILEFTAPDTAGDYDYLCTFPGHWRMMRGIMKVTE